MTKKELAQIIVDELHIPRQTALKAVQRVFDGIIDALVTEGRIELRNFGIFEVKHRKARKARNPRSGEAVDVPEQVGVKFKPGKEMKAQVRRSVVAVGQ